MVLVGEGKIFCTGEFQLINAEGIIELEKITILQALMKQLMQIMVINSCKNY